MLHGCTQSAEDFAAGTRMNFICVLEWRWPARAADFPSPTRLTRAVPIAAFVENSFGHTD
jgi:hypothetical protein